MSICDAENMTSISKLLELDERIIVTDFKAHSPLWHSKLPKDIGNKIASEIDLSYHVVLNKKASKRATDSCKSSPDISLASSSIAMNIDCRMEYALGSDHLPIVLSVTCDLIIHTTPQRTFNFSKELSAKLTRQVLKTTLN